MIYIIHKMLVLLKNNLCLNYLIDSIFECFFRDYNRRFFAFFSQHIMMQSLSLEKRKHK